MALDNRRTVVALPRLGSLLGAVFVSSVLANQIYGTVLALSGTVALGYFPVILSLEGLAAGIIGLVTGLLAVCHPQNNRATVLHRRHDRRVGSVRSCLVRVLRCDELPVESAVLCLVSFRRRSLLHRRAAREPQD